MEPVEVSEVTPQWPDGLANDPRAAGLVNLAWLRIISRVPSIPERLASGRLDRGLVVGAVAEVVARHLLAPADGATSETLGAGPFNRSRTFDSGTRLWISDADLVDLLPPASSSHGWGQIGLGVQPWQVPGRR